MDDDPAVEDLFAPEDELTGSDVLDPAEVAQAIANVDKRWKAGQTVQLGKRQWQPSLFRVQTGKRAALLHVHAADRLRSYALERMRLAFDTGIEVHVALPLRKLYDEDLLLQLVAVDPRVHVIDEPLAKKLVEKPPRLLATLADRQITVSADTRKSLALAGHTVSQLPGTNDDKGKRLEALVAFILSQVDDFVVIERNFRTATGEIDIVVQQRATTGRLWATLNAPLILVEAKNRAEPVSQEMVTVFRAKMQTSRGGVRLGIIVAAATVTEDASLQELKFATENLTIAFITKRELDEWISVPDPDGWLERHFSRAMIR